MWQKFSVQPKVGAIKSFTLLIVHLIISFHLSQISMPYQFLWLLLKRMIEHFMQKFCKH